MDKTVLKGSAAVAFGMSVIELLDLFSVAYDKEWWMQFVFWAGVFAVSGFAMIKKLTATTVTDLDDKIVQAIEDKVNAVRSAEMPQDDVQA